MNQSAEIEARKDICFESSILTWAEKPEHTAPMSPPPGTWEPKLQCGMTQNLA